MGPHFKVDLIHVTFLDEVRKKAWVAEQKRDPVAQRFQKVLTIQGLLCEI